MQRPAVEPKLFERIGRTRCRSEKPRTSRTFLASFRAATDGYLLVIIDGAPYHKGAAVTDFSADPRQEVELFHLPAYSPDLNPQEHVWKLFRKHQTYNRSFTSTADTLQAARSDCLDIDIPF